MANSQLFNLLFRFRKCYSVDAYKNELFFSERFKKGIIIVGDIVDVNGVVLWLDTLKLKYGIEPNILYDNMI